MRKAKAWLEAKGIKYETRHIVDNPPTAEELASYHAQSGGSIRSIINTSGIKYRELGLKDKLASMSDQEIYELIASDGMLIKRPIITNGKVSIFGFKEDDWEAQIQK